MVFFQITMGNIFTQSSKKAQAQVQTKAQAQVQTKAQAQVQTKAQAQVQTKAQVQVQTKAQVQVQTQEQLQAENEAYVKKVVAADLRRMAAEQKKLKDEEQKELDSFMASHTWAKDYRMNLGGYYHVTKTATCYEFKLVKPDIFPPGWTETVGKITKIPFGYQLAESNFVPSEFNVQEQEQKGVKIDLQELIESGMATPALVMQSS
jgi:hypothetical protein